MNRKERMSMEHGSSLGARLAKLEREREEAHRRRDWGRAAELSRLMAPLRELVQEALAPVSRRHGKGRAR